VDHLVVKIMKKGSEFISCARLMHLVLVLKRPTMLNKLIGTRTQTKCAVRENGLLILFLLPPPPPYPILNVNVVHCHRLRRGSTLIRQKWEGRAKGLEQRQRNDHDSEFCTSVSRYDLSRIVGNEYYLSNK